jgi:glucokinase
MYCSGKALAIQAATVLGTAPAWDTSGPFGQDAAFDCTGAEMLINAGKAGHPAAVESLQRAFHYLGLGIANLVSLVNPSLVLLGGGIVAGWPSGIELVRATVKAQAVPLARDCVALEQAKLGENAGLVGASFLVQDLLARPLSTIANAQKDVGEHGRNTF